MYRKRFSTLLVGVLFFGSLFFANLFAVVRVPKANAADLPDTCPTSELAVVAHQDDDILFMNPDIQESIAQGRCMVTVFLTGGEWDGVSGANAMSREQYAALRDEGTRAAYATMANAANNWTREVAIFNGNAIEVATLNDVPSIQLVYLHLRDGGDSVSPHSLDDLYKGVRSTVKTFVPANAPAGIVPVTYTKAGLSDTIASIMDRYQASLIRTQDYLPDSRLRANHADHMFGALFAVDAAKKYDDPQDSRAVSVVTYRDYNIVDSPANLSSSQMARKNTILDAYKKFDPIFAVPADQNTNAARMYYRWPVAPTWAVTNRNGTLQAFDVQNGKLVTWMQDAGGDWLPKQSLGGDGLQPGVGVGMNTDGTLQVFAIKQTINAQGQVRQDLQYIKQTVPGGPFGTWQNLGNPGVNSAGLYDISSPAVVPNGDGRLEVFVKDSRGGLATIYQTVPGGNFSGWVGLGGDGLVEAPAAILRGDGRIEVYGATTGLIKHWLQRTANGSIVYDTQFTSVRATGTPSVGFNQDGRPEIFYRQAGSGQLYTTFQMASGMWYGGEIALQSQGSQGAPAVVSSLPIAQVGSRMVLLARKTSGFETTAQRGDNEAFALSWRSVQGYSQHAPAAVRNGQGQILFLSVSHEGDLMDGLHTTDTLLNRYKITNPNYIPSRTVRPYYR